MQREVLRGQDARQLGDWASIWGDLLQACQALAAHLEAAPGDVFKRRAFWESTVVSYGRCFNSGTRRAMLRDVLSSMPDTELAIHSELLRWRNKHVGHRVDADLERVAVLVTRDDERSSLDISFETTTSIAPAEPELARYEAYLLSLRNRVWEGPLVQGENDLRERLGYERLPFVPEPSRPG